jgi:hypothetical protein
VGAPILAIGPLSAQSAGADSGPNFDATASAYGVDQTVSNPSLPLGLTLEGAGPVAQAHLDSLGDSDALASFPYPGDVTAGLPGTAGALFGVPIPQYPLYVTSQAGDQPKSGGAPGVTLSASSYPTTAIGHAVVGTDLSGFTSTGSVTVNSDNSVTAHAETVMGVNLLNLVTLSGVDSSATATADGFSGDLTRTSHLSIGQISAPGLSITVPPSTPGNVPVPVPVPGLPQLPPIDLPTLPLPLGGETLQVFDLGFEDGTFTVQFPMPGLKPLTYAIPAQFVLDAFTALGIKVTYEAAQTNTSGVISPALTFTSRVPAPPSNPYFDGPTDISFTLGRSSANVTLRPVVAQFGDGSSSSVGLASGSGTTGGGTSGTGVSSAGQPAAGRGVAGGGGAASSGSGGTTPLATEAAAPVNSSPPAPSVASGPAPESAQQQPDLALVSRDGSRGDLSGIYLLGFAIAAVVIAAAAVLKVMGVRLQ